MPILKVEFSKATILAWCFASPKEEASREEQDAQFIWLSQTHTWCYPGFNHGNLCASEQVTEKKGSSPWMPQNYTKLCNCMDWQMLLQIQTDIKSLLTWAVASTMFYTQKKQIAHSLFASSVFSLISSASYHICCPYPSQQQAGNADSTDSPLLRPFQR